MKKLHHHHKNEAMHHKERHHHKMKSHSMMEKEYSFHPKLKQVGYTGMEHLIGGVVKDDHQQGISRKILRPGEMDVNQHGSMSGGWKHEHMSQELTPRKG